MTHFMTSGAKASSNKNKVFLAIISMNYLNLMKTLLYKLLM